MLASSYGTNHGLWMWSRAAALAISEAGERHQAEAERRQTEAGDEASDETSDEASGAAGAKMRETVRIGMREPSGRRIGTGCP